MVNEVVTEEVVDFEKIKTEGKLLNVINDAIKDNVSDEIIATSRGGVKTKLLRIYLSLSKQPYNSYIIGNKYS